MNGDSPIKYIVVCNCGGEAKAVAFIDDRRPVGGSLSVRGIGEEDTAALFTVADGRHHGKHYRQAAKSWAEHAVTETTWADGHSTWIVRCVACPQQAQLSDPKNLVPIADQLAARIDEWPLVPSPGESQPRRMIPLGVLCRMVAHFKW
ncbi:hypothetical protein [uncultured Mycobacterium sp.]|uniref:hypothetical protein n=1 Tax=uncultured Mycobacterium sp. TaxID=171292 RepID=UPI0035CC6A8B